jgi:hypothetical protein
MTADGGTPAVAFHYHQGAAVYKPPTKKNGGL